jgi:hypothetical protein
VTAVRYLGVIHDFVIASTARLRDTARGGHSAIARRRDATSGMR